MKKYICLRDDDTSFVTKPEDLISGYGDFWGVIPVTLATIPFVHRESLNLSDLYRPGEDKYKVLREFEKSADGDFLTEYYKVFPVGGNKELIQFLSPLVKNNLVEIAQHGVFHKYSESGPEMLSHKMSYESIRDAKEYLEKVFRVEVKTFVPPSNTIDVQCIKWLKSLNLNLITSGTISRNDNFKKTAFELTTLPIRLFDKFFSVPWSQRPTSRQFGMYIMRASTFGTTTNLDEYLETIKIQLNRFGFAAIATHYTCFYDNKCKHSFWELLGTLLEDGDVEFVTAERYYHQLLTSIGK